MCSSPRAKRGPIHAHPHEGSLLSDMDKESRRHFAEIANKAYERRHQEHAEPVNTYARAQPKANTPPDKNPHYLDHRLHQVKQTLTPEHPSSAEVTNKQDKAAQTEKSWSQRLFDMCFGDW